MVIFLPRLTVPYFFLNGRWPYQQRFDRARKTKATDSWWLPARGSFPLSPAQPRDRPGLARCLGLFDSAELLDSSRDVERAAELSAFPCRGDAPREIGARGARRRRHLGCIAVALDSQFFPSSSISRPKACTSACTSAASIGLTVLRFMRTSVSAVATLTGTPSRSTSSHSRSS